MMWDILIIMRISEYILELRHFHNAKEYYIYVYIKIALK